MYLRRTMTPPPAPRQRRRGGESTADDRPRGAPASSPLIPYGSALSEEHVHLSADWEVDHLFPRLPAGKLDPRRVPPRSQVLLAVRAREHAIHAGHVDQDPPVRAAQEHARLGAEAPLLLAGGPALVPGGRGEAGIVGNQVDRPAGRPSDVEADLLVRRRQDQFLLRF